MPPIFHNGNEVNRVFHGGVEAEYVLCQGKMIFPEPDPRLPNTPVRIVLESDAFWFEFGWPSAETLTGSAADGWQDENGYCRIRAVRSQDLATWDHSVIDSPSSPESDGQGNLIYWVRSTVPCYWIDVMIDVTAQSDRYGKSITAIQLFGNSVSLPHFPYAMPSQAATLQADLRAAGYTGATVTSVSAPLSATAKWHTQAGAKWLVVSMTGSNVTGVTYQGSTVGTGYPYSMPSQKAALQTMLTAALGGDPNNKAVVMLHGDAWTVTIPNRVTTGKIRDYILTITPDDPYPGWDMFGNYQGMQSAAAVSGHPENTRNPSGEPLQEADRQFGRFGLSLGSRYDT